MELKADGLSLRLLLRERLVPYDEIVGQEGRRLRLRSGEELRIAAGIAEELAGILRGPRLWGTMDADARAFLAYLSQRWSPARAARHLLDIASRLQASDVHIEPEPASVAVRLRLAGEVQTFATLPVPAGSRLIAALKGLSGCLPYRRDIVQEGRIPRDGVSADVRASFIPTVFGERVALRLFGRLLKLHELGFDRDLLGRFESVLRSESGLVLVAGSSGAGKTTTLYSSLEYVAGRRRSAHLSIEDPIEQRLRAAGVPVDQLELCPERGLTGEAALVAALRQDVDVVAVGEVRTSAEAELAVKAAHTGRLVLAGVHAGSVDEALQRLRDLGVESSLVQKTVLAILHQRLRTVPCSSHDAEGCVTCGGHGRRRAVEATLHLSSEIARREAA